MTRPSPSDRITLHEAAALAKLSYSEVYRRVREGLAPAEQAPDGSWTMSRGDALAMERRGASKDPRKTVHIRAPKARVERWLEVAGDRPLAGWAAEILDSACDGDNLQLLTRTEMRRWRQLSDAEGLSPLEWLRKQLGSRR